MMCSSLALYCLKRLSVVSSNSSCRWSSIFNFSCNSLRSTSLSTFLCAIVLIQLMEYVVLFPSILVNSLILVPIRNGFSLPIHSVAFFGNFFSSFNGFSFGLVFIVCLCEGELIFISAVRGRCCHLFWR